MSATSHYLSMRRRAGGERLRTAYTTVTLCGNGGPDHGVEIEVHVNFMEQPTIPARLSGPPEDCYPAEGGERELRSSVPFKFVGSKIDFLPCPMWLADMLAECIDVDALTQIDED